MRIMGLDYGSKTVGVAMSDPLGITAQAVETIWRKDENKLRKTCARIEELISEYEVERIVLGLPKHMNNDLGERAEKALAFGEMVKRRTGLEVVMWDERLTTVEAERTLIENNVRRENRKQYFAGIPGFDWIIFNKIIRTEVKCRMEKITMLSDENGEELEFYVLEQTKVNGVTYILVTDSEYGDAECTILKDTSDAEDKDCVFEFVEDDVEMNAVFKIFEELLEDVDIER